MRRFVSRRLFAAFFAPWFAVVVTEPVPMHDCPMHSVHPAAAVQHAADTMPMDGMSPMAGNEPTQPVRHHAAGHGAHHQCCCLDACSAGAAAPATGTPQLAWVPVEIRAAIPRAADALVAPRAIDHARPFANGPPAPRA